MSTKPKTVEAWHFLREDRRLQYEPHTLVEVGQTLRVEPPVVLCKHGLHGSRRAIDALKYAPGPIVCRVRLSGEIIEDDDKLVAPERTVLAMADATTVLHTFACDVAEEAVRKHVPNPDPRSLRAIEVKRLWITGEATDDELDAARAAARDAARAAAWAAARAAAWAAARDAARDAARAAARAAAWAAAWDAAWDAARAAARAAQNATLEDALYNLLGVGT